MFNTVELCICFKLLSFKKNSSLCRQYFYSSDSFHLVSVALIATVFCYHLNVIFLSICCTWATIKFYEIARNKLWVMHMLILDDVFRNLFLVVCKTIFFWSYRLMLLTLNTLMRVSYFKVPQIYQNWIFFLNYFIYDVSFVLVKNIISFSCENKNSWIQVDSRKSI